MKTQSDPQAWVAGNCERSPTTYCRIIAASMAVTVPLPFTSHARRSVGVRPKRPTAAMRTRVASIPLMAPRMSPSLRGTICQSPDSNPEAVNWPLESVATCVLVAPCS